MPIEIILSATLAQEKNAHGEERCKVMKHFREKPNKCLIRPALQEISSEMNPKELLSAIRIL